MSADRRGEGTNGLPFEALKAIQGVQARHADDLGEIKERIGSLKMQCASL